MEKLILTKSQAAGKKWTMYFYDRHGENPKMIHFGAQGYEDFTQHKNKVRQRNYLQRHRGDPKEYNTAGELSRVILWSADNLREGIANFERKHNVQIERRDIAPCCLRCGS